MHHLFCTEFPLLMFALKKLEQRNGIHNFSTEKKSRSKYLKFHRWVLNFEYCSIGIDAKYILLKITLRHLSSMEIGQRFLNFIIFFLYVFFSHFFSTSFTFISCFTFHFTHKKNHRNQMSTYEYRKKYITVFFMVAKMNI